MDDIAAQYHQHAIVCSKIDYADPATVKASNPAVNAMYALVEQAERDGADAVAKLVPLLDDPLAQSWLAHQLVEKATISSAVRQKCIAVREKLAEGDGPGAMGEQMLLKEWRDGCER